MSWSGYIPGDLVNEIDWCKFYGEEAMSNELLYRAAYLIPQSMAYSNWEGMSVGTTRNVVDLGAVKLVKNERNTDGWDESNDMTLIFEVVTPDGVTAYFKKIGFEDSYGTEKWDGNLVPVARTTKTVTDYSEA